MPATRPPCVRHPPFMCLHVPTCAQRVLALKPYYRSCFRSTCLVRGNGAPPHLSRETHMLKLKWQFEDVENKCTVLENQKYISETLNMACNVLKHSGLQLIVFQAAHMESFCADAHLQGTELLKTPSGIICQTCGFCFSILLSWPLGHPSPDPQRKTTCADKDSKADFLSVCSSNAMICGYKDVYKNPSDPQALYHGR